MSPAPALSLDMRSISNDFFQDAAEKLLSRFPSEDTIPGDRLTFVRLLGGAPPPPPPPPPSVALAPHRKSITLLCQRYSTYLIITATIRSADIDHRSIIGDETHPVTYYHYHVRCYSSNCTSEFRLSIVYTSDAHYRRSSLRIN